MFTFSLGRWRSHPIPSRRYMLSPSLRLRAASASASATASATASAAVAASSVCRRVAFDGDELSLSSVGVSPRTLIRLSGDDCPPSPPETPAASRQIGPRAPTSRQIGQRAPTPDWLPSAPVGLRYRNPGNSLVWCGANGSS